MKCHLSEINNSKDYGKIVPLKLLMPIVDELTDPPARLIMIDAKKNVIAASLYNIDFRVIQKFNSKNIFHVISPRVKQVQCCEGEIQYQCLHIDDPRLFIKDRERYTASRSVISTETMDR